VGARSVQDRGAARLLAGDEANAKSRFGRLRQNGRRQRSWRAGGLPFAKKETIDANNFLGLARFAGRPNMRAIFPIPSCADGWVAGGKGPVRAYDPTAGRARTRARGLPVPSSPKKLENDLPRGVRNRLSMPPATKDEPPPPCKLPRRGR